MLTWQRGKGQGRKEKVEEEREKGEEEEREERGGSRVILQCSKWKKFQVSSPNKWFTTCGSQVMTGNRFTIGNSQIQFPHIIFWVNKNFISRVFVIIYICNEQNSNYFKCVTETVIAFMLKQLVCCVKTILDI